MSHIGETIEKLETGSSLFVTRQLLTVRARVGGMLFPRALLLAIVVTGPRRLTCDLLNSPVEAQYCVEIMNLVDGDPRYKEVSHGNTIGR